MAGSEDSRSLRGDAAARALRLTFQYRGRGVRLIGSQRLVMVVPPPVTPPPARGQSGYWIELIDATGRVVYHRPLYRPIAVDAEVYAADGKQTIARVPVANPEGEFTVLVPDLPQADVFALHGPPDPESPAEPARELLRVDVDALRKFPPERPEDRSAPDAPKGS